MRMFRTERFDFTKKKSRVRMQFSMHDFDEKTESEAKSCKLTD